MALTDSLTVWHDFDETSDGTSTVTRVDEHTDDGTSQDLTDNNTVKSISGHIGTAAEMVAGNNEYFSHSNGSNEWDFYGSAFTWAFWYRPSAHPGGGESLFFIDADRLQFSHTFGGGTASLSLRTEDGSFTYYDGTLPAADGATWWFLTLRYDGANNIIKVQVNTKTEQSDTVTTDYADIDQGLEMMGGAASDDTIDRAIDSLGFWTRDITDAERSELYNSGNGVAYADITGGTSTTMVAANGSFSLAGQTAGLQASYKVTADNGLFVLNGQAANLNVGRLLTAANGSFSLTGQAAALQASYIITAANGSFNAAGQSVTLTDTTGSTILTANAGTFTLSGQTANLLASFNITADNGLFVLDGRPATFPVSRMMVADSGSFSLAGQAVALKASLLVTAESGTFVLAGQDALLAFSGDTNIATLEVTLTDALVLDLTIQDIILLDIEVTDSVKLDTELTD